MNQRFTAVVSYGRKDVSAAADKDAIIEVLGGIESQVNAILSRGEFELWRDLESIDKGDRWRDAIYDAIDRSDLLIILLSPSWFRSDHCWNEFMRFDARFGTSSKTSRILPVQLRPVDPEKLHGAARDRFDHLGEYQIADWRQLVTTAPSRRPDVVFSVLHETATVIERRVYDFLSGAGDTGIEIDRQAHSSATMPPVYPEGASPGDFVERADAPMDLPERSDDAEAAQPVVGGNILPQDLTIRAEFEIPGPPYEHSSFFGLLKERGIKTGEIYDVAISDDGRQVAYCAENKSITIWDAEAGTELREFEETEFYRGKLAFSRDGRRLVAGNWGQFRLWDLDTGACLFRRDNDRAFQVKHVAICGNGRLVATIQHLGRVTLLDTESEEARDLLEGGETGASCLAASRDGGVLVCGLEDGTVRIWDLETPANSRVLHQQDKPLEHIAISADGRRIAWVHRGKSWIYPEKEIWIWDAGRPDGTRVLSTPFGINCLAMSADGNSLVASHSEYLHFWDADEGTEALVWKPPDIESPTSLVISRDGRRIAMGTRYGLVRILDAVVE